MENNSYKTLSAISVKEKVKKKGHLNYLPWSHAWHILKTHYPSAQRIVYESEHTGLNYFTDGVTAYVKVGLIVNGLEHIDYLPVMDNKNASVSIEKVTSRDINDTIMRSTVKAIALHGLGLSLLTGEESVSEPTQEEAPKEKKLLKLDVDDENWDKVLKYIVKNKAKGLEALVEEIGSKYKVTASVKKSFKKAIADAE